MRKLSKSIYSFVAWIATIFVYICFIAWAFLPRKVLYSLGVTYYPSRYYAIALPAYIIVSYVLFNIAYIGLNMMNTLNPNDIGTIRDKKIITTSFNTNNNSTNNSSGNNNSNNNKNNNNNNNISGISHNNNKQLTFIRCGVKEGIPEIGDIDPIQVSRIFLKR
eukprot:gene10498-14109_t